MNQPRGPAVPVALATAAALLGDTFLYTALPVNAFRLGLDGLAVGLVLSLNRWVRLATNPVAARLYERIPAGALVAVALLLAAATTSLYALPTVLVVFFAARLLWGLCWSLLRLGSYLAAIDDATLRAGRRLGEVRAIYGLGYFAGALYAPFAVERLGWGMACVVAALLTAAFGLGPVVIAAGWRRGVSFVREEALLAPVWHAPLLALFLASFVQYAIFSGVLIVVGGFRVAELFPEGSALLGWTLSATLIAGAFVLMQRIAQVAWPAIAGRFADRSAALSFVGASALATLGTVALAGARDATAFVALGLLVFFAGVTAIIAVELAIARRCTDVTRPRVFAAYNTWADVGAALGALSGGVLGSLGATPALAASAALVALTLPLWWLATRASARVAALA